MRSTIMGLSALLLTGAPAFAAPPGAEAPAVVSVRIPVQQSDLESDAALAALYERVVAAADQVCRETNLSASWLDRPLVACRRQTVKRAIDQAGLAPLSHFHDQMVARRAVRPEPVLAAR